MAEIETSIDSQIGLTVQTLSGRLTSREILTKLDEYYRGETTLLILWDFTNATWSGITSAELRATVKEGKKYSRKGGKTALVFATDVDFGIGRMLEAYAYLEGFDFVFNSFRDMREAELWLEVCVGNA